RHLLRPSVLVPDFGFKAALNGLRHDSLRSVDSFTLEEQPVHRRAQASRASSIETFGLDVARDIVRAVTGTPRADVSFRALAGAESSLSIAAPVDFSALGSVCDEALRLYGQRSYREFFPWVDNIRPVRDPSRIDELEAEVLEDLRQRDEHEVYLSPPEP